MKTWKRALALVLALVMALSLVALPSFAEGEETGGGTESTQPVWPAEGSIKLDKDAKAVEGKENLWEVTLGIQGKNYKTTSDVVLVIDCSGSMEGTKLTNTRAAAKAFGEKLLTEGSATRIAIVTFIDEATAYNDGHFYTASELSAFETAVDKATYANGGTNQQAGIHVAQQLLDSSPAGNLKNIVILSDGEPTYSYRLTGTAGWTGCYIDWRGGHQWGDWVSGGKVDSSTISVTGCSYELVGTGYAKTSGKYEPGEINLAITCEHGKSRTVNSYFLDHSVATIWEANQAKAAGTTIFSVALQAGTDGENTLKACATDAAKGYYAIGQNDNVEEKLTAAFEAIAGSIAIAASNGSVADTMGDKVQLSFSGAAPVITTDKVVYDAGKADVYISQGSATYDVDARRINWTVGSVREGDNPIMKYKVTVREGYNPSTSEVLDANESATFSYKNYLSEDTVGTFPVPQVTVGGGNILVHYYLVNDQGQPINENGTVVESPALAKQVKTAAYHEENGSTGLSYNTPYTVSHDNVANYNYFGSYILNDSNLTKGNSVDVTLTAANSNQHVWFAYYQTFNVAHIRMNDAGAAQQVGEIDTYPVSSDFDLTDKVNKDKDGNAVTEGTYLYGGAFNSEACTEVYPFAEGETGLSFVPQAGATYYIWEVPNTYLIPKVLYGNGHYEDTGYQMDVVGLYMVSAIDRSNYAEVGFYLDDERTKAAQTTYTDIVDNREETKIVTVSGSVAFRNVSITKKDTTTDVYTASSLVPADKHGYMLCYGVSKESKWQTAGNSFTYYPYWVTLDGVEVTNGTTRTVTYNGPGYGQPSVSDSYDRAAECKTPAANASAQLLLMDSYCADGTPIAADTPAVENVTVTVVDSAKTYELTVSAGTGIRDQVAYQAPAGKIFAGWFADQAYTTPADLDQVTQDTTIYAKYVSDSYLDLAYSRTGLFRLRGVTLISAVDNPANYQAYGFIVGDQKVDVSYASRYLIFKTPANLFGAARDAKLMLADKSLSGTGTLEVTPYWITLDGTEVHGVTHTLHYNTRTIWE